MRADRLEPKRLRTLYLSLSLYIYICIYIYGSDLLCLCSQCNAWAADLQGPYIKYSGCAADLQCLCSRFALICSTSADSHGCSKCSRCSAHKHGKAKQSKAKQSNARRSNAKQSKAKQSKVRTPLGKPNLGKTLDSIAWMSKQVKNAYWFLLVQQERMSSC